MVVRDHQDFLAKVEKSGSRIHIPQMIHKSEPDKELIWGRTRNQIISEIKKSDKFLEYKNLVSPDRKNQIIQEEQLEEKILNSMGK